MDPASERVDASRAPAGSAAGRLWLLAGYWAFGLALRWPVAALNRHLRPGAPRELLQLALKTTLSVILPALFATWLKPDEPVAQQLGLRSRADAGRRPRLAGALAVGWFVLLFVLSTLQDGHAPALVPTSLAAVLLALAHELVEEIAFRGFILGWLSDGRAFWKANAITSAMFLSMHLPGWYASGMRAELVPMSLVLLALSLVLGWVTRLSGTIGIAVALHLANNVLSGW